MHRNIDSGSLVRVFSVAVIRALSLFVALAGFFLLGAPLQWLVARYLPRLAHHIPLVFCRTLLRLVGVRIAVEGARAVDGPTLMVANHISWIDILALGTVTPFCFLAKREVSQWPVLSAFAEVQGTVFVDRRRKRSIPPANKMLAQRMGEGRAVLLFPEGTTVAAAEPATFRSSHFAAARDFLHAGGDRDRNVRVQPVAIAYSSPVAAWVGDEALLPHLWRVLRSGGLDCALTFAAPIRFDLGSDRKLVARRAREAIVDLLTRPRLVPRAAGCRDGECGDEDLGEPAVAVKGA